MPRLLIPCCSLANFNKVMETHHENPFHLIWYYFKNLFVLLFLFNLQMNFDLNKRSKQYFILFTWHLSCVSNGKFQRFYRWHFVQLKQLCWLQHGQCLQDFLDCFEEQLVYRQPSLLLVRLHWHLYRFQYHWHCKWREQKIFWL